jgi:hypothetical protein
MTSRRPSLSWLSLGLLAAALSWQTAQAETPKEKPTQQGATQHLGEAAISNQVLRIVLSSSAHISLFNARGQLLYQMDGQRGVESLPLKSIDFGFLYLTLRHGQVEQSFRLLHNGK